MKSDLSIVIPAYNESERLPPTIKQLKEYLVGSTDYEVIIVDDGSKDNTYEVAKRLVEGWPQAQVIRLDPNQGKGGAVQTGVLKATKQNLFFMDADNSTELSMFDRLLPLLTDKNPVVIGSRDIKGSEITVHQNFFRETSARLFNLWIQFWLLPGIWDTQCGFKAFKTKAAKEIFKPLQEKRFGFDVEILYRAKMLGYPILEVPVKWANVPNSRVNPIRDGLSMAYQVVKIRFTSKR